MADFPNSNVNGVFKNPNAWAPGAIGFNGALKYWQSLLNTNGAGNGLPQLATGAAQSPVGAAYQSQPYNPSQDAGIAAYGQLKGGEAGARSTGRNVQNQVQQEGIKGATSTADAYGNSLISHIQGQIAQNSAESQANATNVVGISGLMSSLFGSDFAKSGLGALLGPSAGGGSTAAGAAAGPFGSLGGLDPSTLAMLGMA